MAKMGPRTCYKQAKKKNYCSFRIEHDTGILRSRGCKYWDLSTLKVAVAGFSEILMSLCASTRRHSSTLMTQQLLPLKRRYLSVKTTSFHFRQEDGSKVLRVVCCTNQHGSILQNISTFSTAIRILDLERIRCKKCQINLKRLVSTVQRGRRPDWHGDLKGLRDVRRP